MISESVVDLSRLQFAMTAMYHFLFVPLTLGLAFLLAIMESVYVMTGKQVYQDMTENLGHANTDSFRLMRESFDRPDFKEGVDSFVEKRSPRFARV